MELLRGGSGLDPEVHRAALVRVQEAQVVVLDREVLGASQELVPLLQGLLELLARGKPGLVIRNPADVSVRCNADVTFFM